MVSSRARTVSPWTHSVTYGSETKRITGLKSSISMAITRGSSALMAPAMASLTTHTELHLLRVGERRHHRSPPAKLLTASHSPYFSCLKPERIIRRPSSGTMVTMVRASLYLIDENKKIMDERDQFLVLSQ